MYTKTLEKLASKMNDFAQARIPFFFTVNFLATDYDILPLSEIEANNIKVDFSGIKSKAQDIPLKKNLLPFNEYQKQFDIVKKEIQYGNSYLCNLTLQTAIGTEENLQTIYDAASAKYKILYKDEWICFSPETFVKIDYRGISSNPMKGTIDAATPHADEALINDPKEIAEHYTIVDLIRNDLSMVAQNVEVQKFRYLSKIETAKGDLLQTSSKIVGELPNDYIDNIGTTFCKLLPAGSITGAPKYKTIEIIKKAESYERGFYTGVAGIFDGEKLDSCVLIRFVEKTKEGLVYKSGGGITKYSDAQKEYDEVKQKIYVPTA